MKTRNDIYWEFLTTAYDYGMYDNLTQAEIDELVAISENRTFRVLLKRHDILKNKIYDTKEFKGRPYYQIMRPTVVLIATHLKKQLANCRGLRVRAIVGGYLRTLLDKMEYHVNIYSWRFVNLINAHPNLSDAELAKYCVANKINITDSAECDRDINRLTEIFQDVRENMKGKNAINTAPITAREGIFAARWLEIYERQR